MTYIRCFADFRFWFRQWEKRMKTRRKGNYAEIRLECLKERLTFPNSQLISAVKILVSTP